MKSYYVVFSIWLPCLEAENPETKIFRTPPFDVIDLDANYSDNTGYPSCTLPSMGYKHFQQNRIVDGESFPSR